MCTCIYLLKWHEYTCACTNTYIAIYVFYTCHFRSVEVIQNDCQISSLRHNKGLYWTAKNSDLALWKFRSGRSLKYRGSLTRCTDEHLCRLSKSHTVESTHATEETAKWSFGCFSKHGTFSVFLTQVWYSRSSWIFIVCKCKGVLVHNLLHLYQ